MFTAIFMKSTYRRWFTSIIMIILIGVSSFLFCEKLYEHYLSSAELKEAGKYYRAVGEILWEDDSDKDLDKIAGYLEACPLVETVNYYGETSGVLESPINNVAYQWAFPDEMDFAGFASGYDIIVKGTYDGYVADRKEYGFIFTINDVLSGYEEYVVPGKEIVLYVPNGRLLSKELEAGKEYIVRGHYSTIVDTTYRPGKLEKHGKKYSDYSVFEMKKLYSEGPLYIEEDGDNTQIETAELSNDIRLMEDNRRAVSIKAYADISAANFLQGEKHSFYLVDGHWPDPSDGNNVCVISKQLSELRGINVGDCLHVLLRDTNDPYGEGYCIEQKVSEYEKIQTFDIEYVVAGVFGENAEIAANYNTIYVPIESIPDSFSMDKRFPNYQYSTYSAVGSGSEIKINESELHKSKVAGTFVLASNDDIEEFNEQTKEYFDAEGVYTFFYENGYERFKDLADRIIQDNESNLRIYGILLVGLFIVVCQLYSISLRKEMGLLRVFGVNKKECTTAFITPPVILGVIAIAIGSSLALINTISGRNSQLDTVITNVNIDYWNIKTILLFAMSIVAQSVLLVVILLTNAKILISIPIMSVFRKNYREKNIKTAGIDTTDGKLKEKETSKEKRHITRIISTIKFSNTNHFRSMDGWMWIAIIISICILGNSFIRTVIDNQKNRLNELYHSISVQVDAVKIDNYTSSDDKERGYISQKEIDNLAAEQYFENFYLSAELVPEDIFEIDDSTGYIVNSESGGEAKKQELQVPIEASTDLPRLMREAGEIIVTWTDGWDETSLINSKPESYPILVPETLYENIWTNKPTSIAVYYECNGNKSIQRFEIAGTYTGGLGYLYTTLPVLKGLLGENLMYYEARFDVNSSFNSMLEDVKNTAQTIMEHQDKAQLIFWDQELTGSVNHIKRVVNILENIYPIMYGFSFVLIAVLTMMLCYLRRKDGVLIIAIGSSVQVGRIVVLMQMLWVVLSGIIMGIIASVIALWIYNQSISGMMLGPVKELSLRYFGISTVVAVIMVSIFVNKRAIRELKSKD